MRALKLRFLLPLAFGLFAIACGVAFIAGSRRVNLPTETSGLVSSPSEWDLGLVVPRSRESMSFTKSFSITNRSDHVLQIHKIQSTCGCLIAEGYKTTLAPGENTSVLATINVPNRPGALYKKLLVTTDSPADRIILAVNATVAASPILVASSPRVEFGAIEAGKDAVVTVIVSRLDGSDVGIPTITFDSEFLAAATPSVDSFRIDPNGVRYKVHEIPVRLTSDSLKPGAFASLMHVRASNLVDEKNPLDLPVTAQVNSRASPFLERVFVSQLATGETFCCKLWKVPPTSMNAVETWSYAGNSEISVRIVENSETPKDTCVEIVASDDLNGKRASIATGILTVGTLAQSYEIPIRAVLVAGD